MLIHFSKTVWLNVKPYDVARVDVDAISFGNLTENAAYYVRVTMTDGTEHLSDYFKTYEDAAACATDFVETLEEASNND